jgi:bifunctional DNase/RNase
MNITYLNAVSKMNNKFICILSEDGTDKKIPISLKESDAYFINSLLEQKETIKQTSYDLFVSTMFKFNISVDKLIITEYHLGIFDCEIHASDEYNKKEVLKCAISDIVIYSYLYNLPIYVDENIFKALSYRMNFDGSLTDDMIKYNQEADEYRKQMDIFDIERMKKEDKIAKKDKSKPENINEIDNIEVLNANMAKAVEEEDYITASIIKKRLDELNTSPDTKEETAPTEEKPKKRGRKKKED